MSAAPDNPNDPRRHLTPLRRRLYPELELTPEGVDPRVIFLEALGRARFERAPREWKNQTWWWVMMGFIGLIAFFEIMKRIGSPFDARLSAGFAALYFFCGAVFIASVHRRHTRRHIRMLLRKRGVAVCLRCGYDLRGLPEPDERCPECGGDSTRSPIFPSTIHREGPAKETEA
ncbi:MAG: hypothetical protein VYC34_03575 [Planctomycetota bacterium]|nr:hypothetical protein [Planctomycetota bacterium]